jgi:imidazoleglycerol phosphate dehydratase HisB
MELTPFIEGEKKMRVSKRLVNVLPRIAAIVLGILFGFGSINLTNAARHAPTIKKFPAVGEALQAETGPVHRPLTCVGITLGQLFAKALGNRKGINRAGYFVLPMDETLAVVALDLGGRPALVYKDLVRVRLVGDLQTELAPDFFGGFVNHAGANLHAKVLYGRSNHHKIEAIFKCFARAMKYACSTDRRLRGQLPSTKGLL